MTRNKNAGFSVPPQVAVGATAHETELIAPDCGCAGHRGAGSDIGGRRLAEQALRASEEKFAKVFRSSPAFMALTSLVDLRYIDVNEAYERTTGYSRAEVIGRTALDIDLWVDEADRRRLLELILRDGRVRGFETRLRRKSGEIILCELALETLEIDGVPCALTMTQDVTSRKRAEDAIRQLAHYDTLTGLANRGFFLEQLRHAVALAERKKSMLALLFVDLDRFKTVNDRWGHAAGDAILAEVGARVSRSLRTSDIAGRIGGDEFVIMLEDCGGREDVNDVADRVRAAFARPFQVDGDCCDLTASMGISIFPEDGSDPEALLRSADSAMYREKRDAR